MGALELSWVLVREAVRAVATPVRLVLWLPRRRKWVARAAAVLQQEAQAADDTGLEGFFAKGPSSPPVSPHVFVSAGEASGEIHAAHLITALPQEWRFSCYGGQRMVAAGGELLHPLSEHAIMGLGGVLKGLPTIVGAFSRYLDLLDRDRPDLIVLVDYPGLHLVMAEAAQRRNIPVLHYVAPQYWAWGPWRMRRYRRAMDGTLTILPFEAAFFRDVGLPSRYVGHPLLDELTQDPPAPTAVAQVRTRPTLVLMPGSRRAEIEANLAGMLRVAAQLRRDDPELRTVIIHRNPQREAPIRAVLTEHGEIHAELHLGALASWLAGARLVLAKSGTGSLEACLHGNPTVVLYKVGRFGHWVSRRLLTVPYVAGANLIAGRQVVPEFVFRDDEGWNQVRDAARELWREGPQRAACIEGLRDVRERLGKPGAAARVAQLVQRFFA